jgi:thiol:disulfide interchange protein DsbA
LALFLVQGASAAGTDFVEGRHYMRLTPAVPQSTPPGTVEVVEVFSYGCPACNAASTFVAKMRKSLPAKAQMVFVPPNWNPSESWPLFQRAYLTAQAMGIADKMHEQVFEAVWRTGEIPLVDPATGRIRQTKPTIEDVAKFYAAHAGVKAEDFVATSKSFAVETRIGQADKLVKAYRAESTPTFVVAGKYRVSPQNASGYDEVVAIIRFLVDKELAEIGGKK